MDALLLALGLVCMVLGILGSFLPVLPGTPLCWLGLLLLYCTDAVAMNYWVLAVTLTVTVIVSVLDYLIPAKGTRHFGGSSYGVWGTNIGLVVGILAPVPFGFIIGPFVGAFVGELIYNAKDHKRAFKAAVGSFAGFLASTFMKLMVCLIFFGLFLVIVWRNREGLF